jgi:2'-5' RNA ligase
MNHNDEIRAFVAIPLPQRVIDYLTELINDLKQRFPSDSLKWVQPANIHLTLKFLGNISKSSINYLVDKIKSDQQFIPFELTINKLGAFPSIYKPQIIWVGTTTHPTLLDLNRHIQNSTSLIENENKNQKFSPHLTIARLRPGLKKDHFERIKLELYRNKEIDQISFNVNHYSLFESTLTSEGPIYSELQRFNL